MLSMFFICVTETNLIEIFCSASGFYLKVSKKHKRISSHLPALWLILLRKRIINSFLWSSAVFLWSVRCLSIHSWQFFFNIFIFLTWILGLSGLPLIRVSSLFPPLPQTQHHHCKSESWLAQGNLPEPSLQCQQENSGIWTRANKAWEEENKF